MELYIYILLSAAELTTNLWSHPGEAGLFHDRETIDARASERCMKGAQNSCDHDDINAAPIPQSADIYHLHEGGGICMLTLTHGSFMYKWTTCVQR